jgi:uncharacterized protein YacL
MVLHVLRGLFVLILVALGWSYLSLGWGAVPVALGLGLLFVAIDALSPRRKLAVFSGVLFGLMVGTLIAYALSFAVDLLADQLDPIFKHFDLKTDTDVKRTTASFVKLLVAAVSCYLAISFTLQSKDDFRFIIPYVEFKKTAKGSRPFLLDTSALIDGRIESIARTGVLDAQLVVPRFVLTELQAVADSGDKVKRARGRRGLEVLGKLRAAAKPEVVLYDAEGLSVTDSKQQPKSTTAGVDERLIDLAAELGARVLTTDVALSRVAQVRGIDAVNLNELATALRPVAVPGERMSVRLVKAGEAAHQGVGYLDDGTMVVIEQGRPRIGEEVEFTVTSALQTSAGRMIFGRCVESPKDAPASGSTAVAG